MKRLKIWDSWFLGTLYWYVEYFLCLIDFEFCLGSYTALSKFLMLKFSKGYCCHNFHPISTKLYGKFGNHGGMQVITCTFFWLSAKFLALIDYVSRAHEIKICPSVRCPSVRVTIISKLNARISFKFWLGLRQFFYFLK